MPRTYQRKTERQSWTPDQLNNALKSIKNGNSIRKAGREFHIPESTLRDKLKVSDEKLMCPALGRKPIFKKEDEEELAQHIITMAKLFYGLTPLTLRRIVYEFATIKKVKNNFNHNLKLAGNDWLYLFLKRNPTVSLRQPEGTSINRISSFNREEVSLFFKNLETVFCKQNFPPNRIYNVDESGISVVQKKSAKIFAKKGEKRVGAPTSAERGKNITIVCCFSAAGDYIPPMIIYPRLRMAAHLQRDGPIGTSYQCSQNGWINDDLFVVWLNHFQTKVKSSIEDPVLLICDNHQSHISLEAFQFCKKNHIVMVSLPPHTSNRLQPLDLTFFGPLKSALSREYDLFMFDHAHRRITVADIPQLFKKSYVKIATMDKAISGFKASGIVPFNPDKFSADDFAPAEKYCKLIVEVDTENESVHSTPRSFGSTSVALVPGSADSLNAGPSNVNVVDIAPIPKRNFLDKENKACSRKQHSQILTSTPLKAELEEKTRKRLEKGLKVKRKLDLNGEKNSLKETSKNLNADKELKKLTNQILQKKTFVMTVTWMI